MKSALDSLIESLERGTWRPETRLSAQSEPIMRSETPKPQPKAEVRCWHCHGSKRCDCTSCWQSGLGECAACKGTGQASRWLQ